VRASPSPLIGERGLGGEGLPAPESLHHPIVRPHPRQRPQRIPRVFVLPDRELIKPASPHRSQLIAEDIAGGAEGAAVAELLAEDAGEAVGAAVGEAGEVEEDEVDAVEEAVEATDVVSGVEADADAGGVVGELGAFGDEAVEGKDDINRWQGVAVRQVNPAVRLDLAVLDDVHRPAR